MLIDEMSGGMDAYGVWYGCGTHTARAPQWAARTVAGGTGKLYLASGCERISRSVWGIKLPELETPQVHENYLA